MAVSNAAYIFYEQPLNEHIRICLRLEWLFNHFNHHLTDTSLAGNTATLNTLLELIITLDRPDLRSRLIKEFNRYLDNLYRLQQQSKIDHAKLNHIMGKVETQLNLLHANTGKFAQSVRSHEFLTSIRQQALGSANISCFDAPNCYYWLHLPVSQRQQQLRHWLKQLDDIRQTTTLLLHLCRESTRPKPCMAKQGFYQTSLDAQTPNQLVRIGIARDQSLFPQCSVGCHGVSIRFMQMDDDGQTTQCGHEAVEFSFACCTF